MKQVHLKLLFCLLLATSITGQQPTAGQNFGGQPFGFGQSQMSMWGGASPAGAFQQQPTAGQFASGFGQAGLGSQFGAGLGQAGLGSQFGAGLGQAGLGSQFGAGFGQAGVGSQFGAGLGQAGLGSQFGAGLGQAGLGSQFGAGFGQAGVGSQFGAGLGQANVAQQPAVDTRNTGSELTSGVAQQHGSSAPVPAADDGRSVSSNVCHNIIDSVFPSFSHYCSVLPQTTFSLPNFFGHNSKEEANNLLNVFRPALDSECFADIRMFTCPLFFPPCDSNAILPCAAFCRAVKSRCSTFDLEAINCDQLPERSEFCPSVTESNRFIDRGNVQDRSTSYNDYGSKTRFVNDYPSTSVLTRSSSSYGTVDRSVPSTSYGGDRTIGGSSYGSAIKSIESSSSYGSDRNIVDNSYGSSVKVAPTTTYGGDRTIGGSSYGSTVKVAPVTTYGGDRNIVDNSYGSTVKVVPSTSYGGDRTIGGSSYGGDVKSTGSAYGSAIKSVGSSSSYGSDRTFADNSYGDSVKIVPRATYGGDRTIGGSSYGSTVKVAPTTTYGGDRTIGSSYGSSVKVAPSTNYGGDRTIGGSSYGSSVKVAPTTTYGGDRTIGGSSYGSTVKVAPSTNYGGDRTIGSSYDNTVKSVSSNSYGNGGNYGGSSYGNTVKSTGSTYGNSNNYASGSSYSEQTYGPPYGIQSTGEYTTYYPEKLDLSQCGPTPADNPCTINGPQFYPIPGYPKCYIQCSLERMFVKPCPNYLVWNTRINACDWPTVAEYPAGNNNYGSSSYSTSNNNYGSVSSSSYGRKKRSTTERKKRFFPGGLFSDVADFEVPLGPPVPGLLPLPGFPGPIGIPGPLIPPPFFGPPLIPPFGPIPPPIIPPIVPPIAPIPPPILPPIVPPIAPIPPPILPPPLLPPFLPPLVPPLPIPLGGPLLPPLPMSIPATFIPGPPPIFGPPFLGGPFGPFGGPLGPIGGPLGPYGGPFGPIGGPFGYDPYFDDPFDFEFGFGGGFPFGDEFYGGHPGPFFEPFPFPAGFDIYDDFGGKGGYGKGGHKKDYGKYNNGGYKKDYGKSYKNNGGYGNSYSDNSYSKSYNKKDKYNGKSYKGSNDYSSGYNSDYSRGDYYRKRRNYDLNVDQDTRVMLPSQERSIPIQSRFLAMHSKDQQIRLPSLPIRQSSPCIGKTTRANIPHPTDSSKYISCLNEDIYEIMECPAGLIYNPSIDQCEKLTKSQLLCERENPCLNGGQCYQTSPSSVKCTCLGPWTGEYCETKVSSCANNPCGEGNECHTLIANDFQQDYVCTCDGQKSYGLTCGRNTVPNPCLASDQEREQYYPFAYSAHAYIQCNGDNFYVRPCAGGLLWNPETKICVEQETPLLFPAEDQISSYKTSYNRPESKLAYTRPVLNFNDQIVDKQQGLRFRNYKPHMISDDQKSFDNSYGQIFTRMEVPKKHRFFSLPLMKEYNRRLHLQKPVMADQQYGQHKTTFMQQTPDRSTIRLMQASSYGR